LDVDKDKAVFGTELSAMQQVFGISTLNNIDIVKIICLSASSGNSMISVQKSDA
jgi:hypothetical protein